MNWLIEIVILVLIPFASGMMTMYIMTLKQSRSTPPTFNLANYAVFRSMAIRLRYLADEGCFSKSGGVVTLDFHGDGEAAEECLNTIEELIATVEK